MATKIKYCTALYFPLKERYISMSAQVGFGYLPRVQSSLCVLMCDRISTACVSGRSRASDVVTLCLTPPVNSPRVHKGSHVLDILCLVYQVCVSHHKGEHFIVFKHRHQITCQYHFTVPDTRCVFKEDSAPFYI